MRKLVGIAVVAFCLTPASAFAAQQYTVTTLTDEQSDPGTGCSLREAITASNNNNTMSAQCPVTGTPSENRIIFSPTLGASPVINLNPVGFSFGQLDVSTNDLTIQGPATVANNNVVGQGAGFRVINSVGINLTLNSLTISGGNETNDGVGGGIRQSNGRLFLINSTVSGNKTTASSAVATATAQGGGIYSTGKVTLTNSTVANNQTIATTTAGGAFGAFGLGGGVEVDGNDLEMQNSVASGNQVLATGNGTGVVEADGGGVRNDGQDLIEHSTISGNLVSATSTAAGQPVLQGAGMLFHGSQSIDVELSTIANNLMKATGTTGANLRGGGIRDDHNTANADYISNTIVGNGLDPASQTPANGGLNVDSTANPAFSNTIIANPAGAGPTCFGGPYPDSSTPNVEFPVDMANPCFGLAEMNITRANPQLGALGNNGGPTQTMLPAPTSPVIDQGTASDQNDLTQDQRGLTRPILFSGLIKPFDGSDIGAVEVQQACTGFTQTLPTTPCPTSGGGGGGGGTTTQTTATAGPTGQRAAALKKCKKKKSKQKRKKCKKKANLLPV